MEVIKRKLVEKADRLGWKLGDLKKADFGRTFLHNNKKHDSVISFTRDGAEYHAYFNGDLGYYLNYRLAKKNGYTPCPTCGGRGLETVSTFASNRDICCRQCGGYKIIEKS